MSTATYRFEIALKIIFRVIASTLSLFSDVTPVKITFQLLITHSTHRVGLWWKNSRIFSRISLPLSGDGNEGREIQLKIQEFFHHKPTL